MFSFFSGKSFPGGIYPPEEKKNTEHSVLEPLPYPKVAIMPLVQHTGKPAKLVVEVGASVKTGDLLAEADGFISAGVHSPFTGVIFKIEPHETPTGLKVLSVFIEVAQKEELSEKIKPYRPLSELRPPEIVAAVKEAGIVGLGGAAFPTHVKLAPPPDKKIKFLLVNGAECEPYLNVDYRLMIENPSAVIGGALAARQALLGPEVIIGIEDNKPEAIRKIRAQIKNLSGFRIVVLKTKYPQGGEKQLIKSILGREVPSGGLPLDIEVVVFNVATLAAIDRTLKTGWPLIERATTVAGDAISRPGNYWIRLGTPIKDIVNFCGGFKKSPAKIIAGGPMMGVALDSLEIPLIKGTSGLLFFSEKMANKRLESVCLRCGKCVAICPLGLLPCSLAEAVEIRHFDQARELSLLDCMECGACAYVCPAARQLVQYIKVGKVQVLKKK